MKNPLTGTFINKITTFDVVCISNGLKEALESGVNFGASIPLISSSAFSFNS
jgi:hypothetical protein